MLRILAIIFIIFHSVGICYSQDSLIKKMSEEIPNSYLSYETVNINMGPVKGKPSIIYIFKGNILLAIDGVTKFLVADVQFDPQKLETKDRDSTFKAVNVWFANHDTTVHYNRKIPNWIKNFKTIKTLLLDIELDELASIKDVLIDNIIFQKDGAIHNSTLLEQLALHKELKNLVHFNSFSNNQIADLKKSIPELIIMTNDEYEMKIKNADSDFLNKWF